MKILIYANIPGGGGAGGVKTYLAALIKALGELKDGDEEYVILGPPEGQNDWLRAVLGDNQRLVVHSPGRQRPWDRAVGFAGRLFRTMAKPVLCFPYFRDLLVKFARHSAATAGIPVSNGYYESFGAAVIHFPFQHYVVTSLPAVFNPHDLQHLHLPQYFTDSSFVTRELVYYYSCKSASRVAVASGWVANDVVDKYGIDSSKLEVIRWGGATNNIPDPTKEDMMRVRNSYAQGENYIFYPAVAWPHKNHERLIEAMVLLRRSGIRIRLLLTGGPSDMVSALNQLCIKYSAIDFVSIAGHAVESDMRALYKAAEAVVVPTLFEAASGPIAEAWLEGVPVACADIPQLRLQAEGAALFFDPYSSIAMAQAISEVLVDPILRENLVTKGSQAIDELSWHATAVNYRKLYRSMYR